jgi:hypothetical protein
MEMEDIMLSEVRQVQKDKGHMFSLKCERQIQIQIQVLAVIYVCVYNIFPKVGLLEETKGEQKEEENDRMNNTKCIISV